MLTVKGWEWRLGFAVKLLQLETPLRDNQRVSWRELCLAVEFEFESIGEHGLEHLFQLLSRCCRRIVCDCLDLETCYSTRRPIDSTPIRPAQNAAGRKSICKCNQVE